jgi:hypothetical protein
MFNVDLKFEIFIPDMARRGLSKAPFGKMNTIRKIPYPLSR